MEEKCEIAERILEYVTDLERYIHDIDKKFDAVVMSCGPSGYVGCSNECRGSGLRRRSAFMEDIAEYLNNLGRKKDSAIIALRPVAEAFEDMKYSKSGHVIYWRIGKGISVQEYAEKFKFSRRHSRRLYIKAMADLYDRIEKFNGHELIEKFK